MQLSDAGDAYKSPSDSYIMGMLIHYTIISYSIMRVCNANGYLVDLRFSAFQNYI